MVTVVSDAGLVQNFPVPSGGDVLVAEIPVHMYTRLRARIKVQQQALAAFILQTQFHVQDEWVPLYAMPIDFTEPSGLLMGASGALTQIAAGASGWFVMDVSAIAILQILARSADPAGSIVSIFATGS